MLSTISKSISGYLGAALALSTDDQSKMEYALQVILQDLSKLLMLFVLFWFLGLQREFLYAMIPLALLRPYTGGLHFSTYGKCLLFSLTFFSAAVVLTRFVHLDSFSALCICGVSLMVILLHAPITSPKRPRYTGKQRLRFKALGGVIVLLHLTAIVYASVTPYLNTAIWVILLQCVQLLFAKGGEIYEKESAS